MIWKKKPLVSKLKTHTSDIQILREATNFVLIGKFFETLVSNDSQENEKYLFHYK